MQEKYAAQCELGGKNPKVCVVENEIKAAVRIKMMMKIQKKDVWKHTERRERLNGV